MARKNKARHEMKINEMIRDSGWYDGTESTWDKLPMEERKNLAFASTGCEVAYPTWQKPVNCVHTCCQVRRGEIPAIAALNRQMRAETQSGWWRFIEDRNQIAKMYRAYRKLARDRKIYDLWKLGGVDVALIGVLA